MKCSTDNDGRNKRKKKWSDKQRNKKEKGSTQVKTEMPLLKKAKEKKIQEIIYYG